MKKLALVLLNAVTFTLSIMVCTEQAWAMESIVIDNTVELLNDSDQVQTIEVYTRTKKAAAYSSKSQQINYKGKHTLHPNEYKDLYFSPGEEVLFRIRSYTQDSQLTMSNLDQKNSVRVRTILSAANTVGKIWYPMEKVVPYIWHLEEQRDQQIQQDNKKAV